MKIGDEVLISFSESASNVFRARVADIEGTVGKIMAVDQNGICMVLLPEGKKIAGYSQPFDGSQHYIHLHQEYLQTV